MEKRPTICNVCGGKVILLNVGKKHSRSSFIYKCVECGASVSTHPKRPRDAMGLLGNEEIKKKRRLVHEWFDKLWATHQEREKLYSRLAKELGIENNECHFSQMSEEQLDKALEIIKKWWWETFDK